MKSTIFWDITQCNALKVNRCFGGIYRFHLQGWGINRAKNQIEKDLCLPPAFTLVSCSVNSSTTKMETIYSSETSVGFQRTTWRYIPEVKDSYPPFRYSIKCAVYRHTSEDITVSFQFTAIKRVHEFFGLPVHIKVKWFPQQLILKQQSKYFCAITVETANSVGFAARLCKEDPKPDEKIRIEEVSWDGSRRWLRRDGKKGIRLWREDLMCAAVTVWLC
jgi:hypothetical protein